MIQKYIEIYSLTPWGKEELNYEKKNIKKKVKYFFVKILPRKILIFSCGILHAYLKPFFQKRRLRKARMK